MVTSNFGKIYHPFQFITTPPRPKKKLWFPMTTPSPIKLCVWFFEVFRGLKIGTLAQNELNGWTRALPISIYYDPPRFVISNSDTDPLLDSYLLFSPTIRNLRGKRRTTFKSFHSIINCINQIVMLILNPNDIYRFFLHSLTHLLMSVLSLMTSKNP